MIRAIHFSFDVPDCSAAVATLHYRGDPGSLDSARLTGLVAPDLGDGPRPVVIIVPGVNIAVESYRWLAERLVEAGLCVVTYTAIGSLGPAGVGISPGIDLGALAPDQAGSRPSASALGPLLERLGSLEADFGAEVAAVVDLDRVGLIGHSAGGTVVLHNANPEWFPAVRAAVAYGAHTMTATALGHGEAAIVEIPSAVPTALIAGQVDGVIESSRDRYRSDDARHDPIGDTFDRAITSNRGDCHFIEIADGNHFTMCDPVIESSGRSFLEPELRGDDLDSRRVLGDVVVGFLVHYLAPTNENAAALRNVLGSSGVSRTRHR